MAELTRSKSDEGGSESNGAEPTSRLCLDIDGSPRPSPLSNDGERGGGLWGQSRAWGKWLPDEQTRSLWAPVFFRVVGGLLVLLGVAYLGQRSRDVEAYGQMHELVPQGPTGRTNESNESSSKREGASEGGEGQGMSLSAVADGPSTEPAPGTRPCPEEKVERQSGLTADGKVILNEATAGELTRLPGVGEARAEAILTLRERLGTFRKKSDLLRVRGIGWRTLQKMKDLMVVDRPAKKEEADAGSKDGGSSDAGSSGGPPGTNAPGKSGSPPRDSAGAPDRRDVAGGDESPDSAGTRDTADVGPSADVDPPGSIGSGAKRRPTLGSSARLARATRSTNGP